MTTRTSHVRKLFTVTDEVAQILKKEKNQSAAVVEAVLNQQRYKDSMNRLSYLARSIESTLVSVETLLEKLNAKL